MSEMTTTDAAVAAEPAAAEAVPAEPETATPAAPAGALVEQELLVEDVSIDGMCGVY